MTMSLIPVLLATAFGGPMTAIPGPERAPSAIVAASQDRDPTTCAAYAQWLGETQVTVRRDATVPVTLFTAVGRGAGSYCDTPLVLSVAFFDRDGAMVCSGTVDLRPVHSGTATYTNLEIQPGNPYEFARWVNGPVAVARQWTRVSCRMPDGRSEAQTADLGRFQSLRLHAVAPGNTTLGIAELRIILQP